MKTRNTRYADTLDVQALAKIYWRLQEDVVKGRRFGVDFTEQEVDIWELFETSTIDIDEVDEMPLTLIADHYFVHHAQDRAENLTANNNLGDWLFAHVDWGAAAKALQADYESLRFGERTWWREIY